MKCYGRLFQTAGVEWRKAHSANTDLTRSTCSRPWPCDRIWRVKAWDRIWSCRLLGCWVVRTLNVITASLYWMRYWTGSQWRSERTGVMWSDSHRLMMIRATEFCTRCNLLMLEDDVWCNRELQYSSCPFAIEQAMIFAASSEMCRRMWRTAHMWKLQDLQKLSTCLLNDRMSSIVTPKLRILLTYCYIGV